MHEALLFSFDRSRLADLAHELRPSFDSARPFPHVVIDGLVPDDVLDQVLEEFPTPDSGPWIRFDSALERKLASVDDSRMGSVTRHLLAELNGSSFVQFLEQLTGVSGLVPDPHFEGGGLHQIEPGGYLDVHADFNRHPITRLDRQLNLILYLNYDWPAEYGGQLELWDAALDACQVSVLPVFNRCVIFRTSDTSFHGHPHPLTCPQGRTRKSLALYYYARADGDQHDHNTLFRGQPAASATAGVDWRHWARRLTPPVALEAAQTARRRWADRRGGTR